MDNPQHYQPLSHAINPPTTQQGYSSTSVYPNQLTHGRDEEDDGDAGVVEEQLNYPEPETQSTPDNTTKHQNANSDEPEPKRRPGRPRGSKNRKNRNSQPASAPSKPPFQYANHTALTTTAAGTVPPHHPDVNTHNQQYYEFQWRVLNLCAEFYGAAEELVKKTPPLVIAQCYQMGPSVKVDPLAMIAEAKRICDTLVANPTRLITNPPPPVVPAIPTYYPAPAAAPTEGPSTNQAPPAVINQPQSFVVSMGNATQYQSVYAPPAQYGAVPYYPYAGYQPPPGTYYPPAPPAASSSSTPQQPQASTSTAPTPPAATGNQGAWSDEETERLKKLADEAKNANHTGDAVWDYVVNQWGPSRTRHQILLKANTLGLKESGATNRGVKRRREDGDMEAATTTSPRSQPASTPGGSPALAHLQRPPSAHSVSVTPAPTVAVSNNMPWPMPTLAVNTPSPVIISTDRSTSYYRPRPGTEPKSGNGAAPIGHTYIPYQPNGSGSNPSRMPNKK